MGGLKVGKALKSRKTENMRATIEPHAGYG